MENAPSDQDSSAAAEASTGRFTALTAADVESVIVVKDGIEDWFSNLPEAMPPAQKAALRPLCGQPFFTGEIGTLFTMIDTEHVLCMLCGATICIKLVHAIVLCPNIAHQQCVFYFGRSGDYSAMHNHLMGIKHVKSFPYFAALAYRNDSLKSGAKPIVRQGSLEAFMGGGAKSKLPTSKSLVAWTAEYVVMANKPVNTLENREFRLLLSRLLSNKNEGLGDGAEKASAWGAFSLFLSFILFYLFFSFLFSFVLSLLSLTRLPMANCLSRLCSKEQQLTKSERKFSKLQHRQNLQTSTCWSRRSHSQQRAMPCLKANCKKIGTINFGQHFFVTGRMNGPARPVIPSLDKRRGLSTNGTN